jgi:hypothetical protein
VGDYLLVPRASYNIINTSFSNDEVELFGYFISEGCVSHRKNRANDGIKFCINRNETELTERILYLMKKIYGVKGKIRDATRNRRIIEFWSVGNAKLFELFGHKARNKKMLGTFIFLNEEQTKILLRALWRGDGSKYTLKSGVKAGITQYEYSTTSTQLAYQIQCLLDKIGAPSYIKYNKKKRAYSIVLTGMGVEVLFGERTNPTIREKTIVTEKYIIVPILKIKRKRYKGKVYDIKMFYPNPYYTTSVLVHNSGEGFGKCLLEATSLKQPVIATAYSAIPEVVGEGGILVPPYEGEAGRYAIHDQARSVDGAAVNQEKFVEAMLYLYENPKERRELGFLGREHAKEFDYDTRIVPAWLDILSTINPDEILFREVLKNEVVCEKRRI